MLSEALELELRLLRTESAKELKTLGTARIRVGVFDRDREWLRKRMTDIGTV